MKETGNHEYKTTLNSSTFKLKQLKAATSIYVLFGQKGRNKAVVVGVVIILVLFTA